jgi:cell division protein DivIC
MKALLDRIPPVFRNFYFVTALLFFLWMLFFDSNDIISHFQLNSKISELEENKAFYEEKIEEVKKDQQALDTDRELLEKIAREKYLMKKENEDVYIVVEE